MINLYIKRSNTKDERRKTEPRTNTKESHTPVRIVPGSLKLRMSRGFRKMSGTTQKLLVAMFRFKKTGTFLAELGARLKMRRERRNTEAFCFFTKKARSFSRREQNQCC